MANKIPETTLSSPLLEAAYDQFFKCVTNPPKNPKTEVERLVALLVRDPGVCNLHRLVRHTPNMTPDLSTLGTSTEAVTDELATKYLASSQRFLTDYLAALRDGAQSVLSVDIEGLGNMRPSNLTGPAAVAAYRDSLFWMNVMESCIGASKMGGWVKTGPVLASRRFAIVPVNDSPILLTYDVVLMLKDMMLSRFLIISLGLTDRSRPRLVASLSEYISWCNTTLVKFGNNAYELIKGIEALSKVRIILGTEQWLDAQEQADEMVRKYVRKEVALGGDGTQIRRLWSYLVSLPTSLDQSDAFGFLKLVGHPYVNPRRGCEKVQKIVHTKKPMSSDACAGLGRSFCHIYTRGFLSSTNKWPQIKFLRRPDEPRSRLEELRDKGQPALAFGFTQYPPTDWDNAVFEAELPFDMGEDILSLMSDKALSYQRTEFDAPWYGKLDYKPPRPKTSKRVLGELLSMEDLNMADIVDRVTRWDIPPEWKIVSVSPKEREMKLEPRMFSKMVIQMRSFFVLTEANLKKGVFKYLHDQTMTLNRQELLARFLDATRSKGSRWVKLIVEIDYASWNLAFDSRNSDPVGRRLDQIYGVPGAYTTAHRFFNECLVVMDNGDYPPEGLTSETRQAVVDGEMYLDTVWSGHDKGFEGITQGVWTAATIAIGHLAVGDLGVPFTANAQGDNVVYSFDVYVPDAVEDPDVRSYLRKLEKDILGRLSKAAESVGHEIKPEECICSSSYFSYGKEMFANGQYIPSLGKFLSRIFPTTSSDTPSVYEYIATVASGGTAATEKSNVSLPCLALCKFVEHLTISRECRNSILHGSAFSEQLQRLTAGDNKVKQVIMDLLATVPGNLGGLPVSSPLEFLYRGHSDPLSSSITGLSLLQKMPGVSQYLTCLTKPWFYQKGPSLSGLILDPYALPLTRTAAPSTSVSNQVTPVLLENIKNRSLIGLRTTASSEGRSELMAWMGTSRPLYPKVLHDLYKCSPFGVVDALARRFTNTRTLINMTKLSGKDLSGVSLSADLLYIQNTMDRMVNVFKVKLDGSHLAATNSQYDFVRGLRERWGVGHLEGVTNLHPLSSGRILWLPVQYPEVKCENEVVVMCPVGSSDLCESTRGLYTPYLGSKTSDKTVGKWVKPIDSSPPLMDVLKILTIQAMMCIPGSNMWIHLDRIARSRTTVDLDLLRNFIKLKFGGTIAHRYQTRDDPTGSFVNVSINWPTHLTISTNNAGDLGAIDYPFDFQEAITCLEGLLSWKCMGSSVPAPFGFVLQVDLSRMSPIADHIVDTPDQPITNLPAPIDSYYLSVTKVTVSSNTTASAQFSEHDILRSVQESGPSLEGALVSHLLSHLTGHISTTTRFGHMVGQLSHRRILDLPELRKISYITFIQALGTAIRFKISYAAARICNRTTRRHDLVVERLVNTEVRRVVPSLHGTLRELSRSLDEASSAVGLSSIENSTAISTVMADVRRFALGCRESVPVQIYLRGPSSVSRTLHSLVSNETLRLVETGEKVAYANSKIIGKALQNIQSGSDEITKVRQLICLTHALRLGHLVSKRHESPEEAIRKVRLLEGPPLVGGGNNRLTRRYRATHLSTLPRIQGDLSGTNNYRPYRPSAEELLQSWTRRNLGCLEAASRWSPLTFVRHWDIRRVLLIGVGDGRIGPAFHPDWETTGIDLGTVLARQGQSMVDYKPPYFEGTFSLHPCSWALGGDIFDPTVQELVVNELQLRTYDLVVIDIDGADPLDRLLLRHKLAQTGVPTICKVFIDQAERLSLAQSFGAYQEPGDRIWSSSSFPENEFFVGFSPAPLGTAGVHSVVGDLDLSSLPVRDDQLEFTRVEPYNLQEAAMELTGDFHDFSSPLKLSQCVSLQSFCEIRNSHHTQNELLILLLQTRIPRKRARAVFELLSRRALTL